ncbi:MAG: apolipoprotein N-acyltransferase [Pseudomonadota bacterium]
MSEKTVPAAGFSMTRLAEKIDHIRVWQRCIIAAVMGGLVAGALPPFHAVFFLWPAFTVLLLLLRGTQRLTSAFWLGGAFGFGYFAIGLYWVGIAFLVDAERFGFVMPFAVAGLAAGMAIFTGLATLVTVATRATGMARVCVFAASWLFFEWLRSWILTGFPWNLIGTVWTFSPEMLQLAAVTGVWGLSVVTILSASAPAVLFDKPLRPARTIVVLVTTLLPLAVWGGGQSRLSQAPAIGSDDTPGVVLRLVQPAIEQSLKWQPELRRKHLLDQMRLSREPGIEKVTHIIWSETAVPYYLSSDRALQEALSTIVPPGGLLITGALRQGEAGDGPYNSLHALDHNGVLQGSYDKFHLVPFGEYAPFRGLLDMAKLTVGAVDFQPGPGPQTMSLPGLPAISPLICYEVIFPGAVTADGDGAMERPGLLLNITNDAWFGRSTGPHQHFATAKLRAVEEGLPLVRAANNGISAVLDSYGREVAQLGLDETGVLDSPLPRATTNITLYSTFGNYTVLFLLLILSFFYIVFRRYRL